MLNVTRVETALDRRRFVHYPYQKYANDSHHILALKNDATERFRETGNPFLEHARMELFLAERSGDVVGRIAVIDDALHNDIHHENILFFGFFEAETQEVALLLMEAVQKRARQLGRGRIRGPVNPSMNEGAGFQVDAFDSTPFIMTSQNPEAYPGFIEAAGYSKSKDLFAWQMADCQFSSEQILSSDYTIRSLDLKNYDAEFRQLFEFYNESRDERHETWAQIPLTPQEISSLANSFKDLVDPATILFASSGNELAGVAFGLPNENEVLAKLDGGKVFPMGWWKLLNKKRLISSIRLSLLEVRPKHQDKDLELALLKSFCDNARARGYNDLEFSWTLEDDSKINKMLESAGAKHYKTYRLYQKNLIEKPGRPF